MAWFEGPGRWGHLAWLGIHWLDLASYITGLKVESVTGVTEVVGRQPIDVEDSAAATLRYSNQVLGTMLSGFYLDQKHKTQVSPYQSQLQIWGEEGWLKLAIFEQEPMLWYSSQEPGEPKIQRYDYPKGQRSYQPFVRAAVRPPRTSTNHRSPGLNVWPW